MKNKKLIIILLGLLLLTACSINSNNINYKIIERNNIPKETPVPGGQVNIPIINSKTIHPLFTNNSSIYYLNNLIYSNLFEYGEDGNIESNIVEHYEFSKDRKTITLTLRDDIYFHDGEKLTADDIIYTFNLIKNLKVGPYYEKILSAAGTGLEFDPENFMLMEKFNDRNIDIKLDKSYNNVLDMLVFPILPFHKSLEEYNMEEVTFEEILEDSSDYYPIGSGPYKVDNIEEKSFINLSIFDNYHGRLPYIERVNAIYFDDYNLAKLAFEIGEIDILNFMSSDWNKFIDNNLVNIEAYHSSNMDILYLNQNSKVFSGEDGKKIKQAIARSINKKRLIDRVYMGNAVEISLPINYEYFNKLNLKSDIYYNAEIAKDLLGQAGYSKLNDQGLLENNKGETINIEIKTNKLDENNLIVFNFIIEDLKSVGINAYVSDSYENISSGSREEKENYYKNFMKEIKAGYYDIVLLNVNLGNTPDIGAFLHSKSMVDGLNFSKYTNIAIDNSIKKIKYNSREDILRNEYGKILSILSKDVPILPLYIKDYALLKDNDLNGQINPRNTDIYNSLRNIYYSNNNDN